MMLNLCFLSSEFVLTQCGYVQISTIESTDFVKADSRKLPVVDPFMMAAYFNALHGISPESHTLGEDRFGPRGVKYSSNLAHYFLGGA